MATINKNKKFLHKARICIYFNSKTKSIIRGMVLSQNHNEMYNCHHLDLLSNSGSSEPLVLIPVLCNVYFTIWFLWMHSFPFKQIFLCCLQIDHIGIILSYHVTNALITLILLPHSTLDGI